MYEYYNKLYSTFRDDDTIKNYLNITKEKYRGATPKASLLYSKVRSYKGDKFTDEFIRLIYDTLSAWGMNSRGARLNKLSIIKKSLQENKERILSLNCFTIKDIEKNMNIQNTLRYLFKYLQLVDAGKTPLVTFSKTMHFYFNNLIVPIDRTYTAQFFNKNVPSKKEKQWDYFITIEKAFSLFSNKIDIGKYIDEERNWNIPKTIDNMIIGYIKYLKMISLENEFIEYYRSKYNALNNKEKEHLEYLLKNRLFNSPNIR
jgi:hypothetical protein